MFAGHTLGHSESLGQEHQAQLRLTDTGAA